MQVLSIFPLKYNLKCCAKTAFFHACNYYFYLILLQVHAIYMLLDVVNARHYLYYQVAILYHDIPNSLVFWFYIIFTLFSFKSKRS